MKVYHSLSEFTALKNAAVTTGTFDGVHLGHKKILARLNNSAKAIQGESVLLTFFPHPRMVLQPEIELKLLNTQAEKIELLRKTGLNHLIIHPFTKEFSRTTSLDFVRNILVEQVGAKKLVIGYDHHFGRNREGSFEHLKEYGPLYGFEVEEIPAQEVDDKTVSSTKIRRALAEGNMEQANEYLTYIFSLHGKIVKGEQNGHKMGYPTANLAVSENYKLIPGNGVYVIEADTESGSIYKGMCNIGERPTFNGKSRSIEAHLFNFKGNLYDEEMEFRFLHKLRDEQKFTHVETLTNQLKEDEKAARSFLG